MAVERHILQELIRAVSVAGGGVQKLLKRKDWVVKKKKTDSNFCAHAVLFLHMSHLAQILSPTTSFSYLKNSPCDINSFLAAETSVFAIHRPPNTNTALPPPTHTTHLRELELVKSTDSKAAKPRGAL